MRGLAYTGFCGIKRFIAKFCEKIAARCADRIVVISPSLRDQAVEEGIIKSEKCMVLGSGSSKGVNLETFRLDERTVTTGREIRSRFCITEDDVVIGYAGRFTPEKGILELLQAFDEIGKSYGNTRLLLVGRQDQRDPLPGPVWDRIVRNPRIHELPFTQDLPSHLAAMDIFVLASYREGFGNAIIEASAMGKPVIATNIPGCRDAVQADRTGLLVDPRDSKSLQTALEKLIVDKGTRESMGKMGRQWVESEFDRRIVWQRLVDLYSDLIGKKDSF
jgi:glycosyltransferase involved in cell wall biosynthesis